MNIQEFKYKFIDYDTTPIAKDWELYRKPCSLVYYNPNKDGYDEFKFKTLDEALEFEINGKKVKEYIESPNFIIGDTDLIMYNWGKGFD